MSMYASEDKYGSGDVARIIWEHLGGNKFRVMILLLKSMNTFLVTSVQLKNF